MTRQSLARFPWVLSWSLLLAGSWARDLEFKVGQANSCDDMLVQVSGQLSNPQPLKPNLIFASSWQLRLSTRFDRYTCK